jgi:hypothetical protein
MTAPGFVSHCGICGRVKTMCACGATPPAPTRRIVERYGERYCAACGFPEAACGCDREVADAPAQDGAESDLARRVRQARGGR